MSSQIKLSILNPSGLKNADKSEAEPSEAEQTTFVLFRFYLRIGTVTYLLMYDPGLGGSPLPPPMVWWVWGDARPPLWKPYLPFVIKLRV